MFLKRQKLEGFSLPVVLVQFSWFSARFHTWCDSQSHVCVDQNDYTEAILSRWSLFGLWCEHGSHQCQDSPWTGHQTFTGRTHRNSVILPFTPIGNLEFPLHLSRISVEVGGTRRKTMLTWGEHANFTLKLEVGPSWICTQDLALCPLPAPSWQNRTAKYETEKCVASRSFLKKLEK